MGFDVSWHPISRKEMFLWYFDRLEEVRAEAQRKLHALYERQDFFDRRLLQSFPTLKSARHSEALAKLREYLENRKQPIKENKEM